MNGVINALKNDYYRARDYNIKIVCANSALRISKSDFNYRRKHKVILDWFRDNYADVIRKPLPSGTGQAIAENAPIWVYWKQGFAAAPELIQICLSSIKANRGAHPVIELSDANIDQYVQIPDDIKAKLAAKVFSIAFYADIIRATLLAKYGGIWMDATMLMTAPFDEQMYRYPFYTNHIDANHVAGINKEMFVDKCRWTVSFLACGEHNGMMELCRKLLVSYTQEKCKNILLDYFVLDYIIASMYTLNPECKKMIENVPAANPMMFWLKDNLASKYDADEWAAVTESTSIFKLDRRAIPPEGNDNTYYDTCIKSLYIN